MSIELYNYCGSDAAIVDAARVSFHKESAPEASGELSSKDAKLIKYLADHRHTTPFRHNSITLRCSAPIFIARQLGKHQAGLSWNEVSRRYVKDTPDVFVPEFRKAPVGSIKQGSSDELMEEVLLIQTLHTGDWGETVVDLFYGYEDLVQMAVDWYEKNVAAGMAPEVARAILPQGMMTEWMWTGNLLAFAHVYKERSAPGAQKEVQEFAKQLDEVIRPLFPVAWAALVDE